MQQMVGIGCALLLGGGYDLMVGRLYIHTYTTRLDSVVEVVTILAWP